MCVPHPLFNVNAITNAKESIGGLCCIHAYRTRVASQPTTHSFAGRIKHVNCENHQTNRIQLPKRKKYIF